MKIKSLRFFQLYSSRTLTGLCTWLAAKMVCVLFEGPKLARPDKYDCDCTVLAVHWCACSLSGAIKVCRHVFIVAAEDMSGKRLASAEKGGRGDEHVFRQPAAQDDTFGYLTFLLFVICMSLQSSNIFVVRLGNEKSLKSTSSEAQTCLQCYAAFLVLLH